jgi:dTDP-4-dehydrorhamnose reductase
MKKALVIGASGFLGSKVADFLEDDFEVTRCSRSAKIAMDITNRESVRTLIEKEKPDLIINAAGLKNPKACEADKELAYEVNALGAKHVADAAADVRSFLVHISTDYVFDGDVGQYREGDVTEPNTEYGKTKLEGERYVLESGAHAAICRTSGVYDETGDNIFTFIFNQMKDDKVQEYFTDVVNSPTYFPYLAKIIRQIIEKNLSGIFHTAGPDRLSRFEMAAEIANVFGFEKNLAKPSALGEKRGLFPKDVSLDTKKIQKHLKPKDIIDTNQALRIIKNEKNKR